MADDKNKNQGQQGDMGEGQQGGAHESPGRNPPGDKSAGGPQVDEDRFRQRRERGEGGQNQQTKR
jgi:hypothetical protein